MTHLLAVYATRWCGVLPVQTARIIASFDRSSYRRAGQHKWVGLWAAKAETAKQLRPFLLDVCFGKLTPPLPPSPNNIALPGPVFTWLKHLARLPCVSLGNQQVLRTSCTVTQQAILVSAQFLVSTAKESGRVARRSLLKRIDRLLTQLALLNR